MTEILPLTQPDTGNYTIVTAGSTTSNTGNYTTQNTAITLMQNGPDEMRDEMKKKIYIAGPMYGYPEHNFPAFERAQLFLRNKGFLPVSPHMLDPQHSGPCQKGKGGIYRTGANGHLETCHLRVDIAALVRCDAIYLLNGWEASRGAGLEISTATHIGLEVYHEEPENYSL